MLYLLDIIHTRLSLVPAVPFSVKQIPHVYFFPKCIPTKIMKTKLIETCT